MPVRTQARYVRSLAMWSVTFVISSLLTVVNDHGLLLYNKACVSILQQIQYTIRISRTALFVVGLKNKESSKELGF